MNDEAAGRIGAMLEEMSARFDLVVEAVSGFGGRFDSLREEIRGQFAEVGGQVRFLSEQIAENRRGMTVARGDLGTEIARIGEALSQARVEFRTQLAESRTARAPAVQRGESAAAVPREELKHDISEAAEAGAKKLAAELKKTHVSLANLARKFDRFDDRVTVQTRDQDQRLRKLERKRSA
ncbi:MAG: hypothetical protein ACREQI_10675 [Candidatus Binataceae bacterium]